MLPRANREVLELPLFLALPSRVDLVLTTSRTACLTMVFKPAQCAERSWRKLNGSALLPEVIQGVTFVDGERQDAEEIAA